MNIPQKQQAAIAKMTTREQEAFRALTGGSHALLGTHIKDVGYNHRETVRTHK